MHLKIGNKDIKESFGLKGQKIKEKKGKLRLYLEGSQTTGIAIEKIAEVKTTALKESKDIFYPFVIIDKNTSTVKNIVLNTNSLGTRLLLNKEVAQSFFNQQLDEKEDLESLKTIAQVNTERLIERVEVIERLRASIGLNQIGKSGHFSLFTQPNRVFFYFFEQKEIRILEKGAYLDKGGAGSVFRGKIGLDEVAFKVGKWSLKNKNEMERKIYSFQHERDFLDYLHKKEIPFVQKPFGHSFTYEGISISSIHSHQNLLHGKLKAQNKTLFHTYEESFLYKIAFETSAELEMSHVQKKIAKLAEDEKVESNSKDIEALSRSIIRYNRGIKLCGQIFMIGSLYKGDLNKKGIEGLSIHQKLRICANLSNTLSILHKKGVYHRDIKLLNIFLDEKLEPVFADFGDAFCTDLHKKKWKNYLGHGGTKAFINQKVHESLNKLIKGGSFKEFQILSSLRDIYALAVTFKKLSENNFTPNRVEVKQRRLKKAVVVKDEKKEDVSVSKEEKEKLIHLNSYFKGLVNKFYDRVELMLKDPFNQDLGKIRSLCTDFSHYFRTF